MDKVKEDSRPSFVLYVCAVHFITYFVFGMIAFRLFKYGELFRMPVISDYYRPSGSVSSLIGPFVQVLRGLVFGLVLLPFRSLVKESRLGWLFLWGLFVGIGILGTPAAAPSSIEGMIYTKLPLWFHLIGFPEILAQTLVFSLLVHGRLRAKDHPPSPSLRRFLESLAISCFAFIGYTAVSILFALMAGAKLDSGSGDPKLLGQFILPLVLIFVVTLSGGKHLIAKHLALYLASAVAFGLYQGLILGSVGFLYVLVAPILPTGLAWLMNRKREARSQGRRDGAAS